MRKLILLFLVLLLIPTCFAWTELTHNTFAKELCYKFEDCVQLGCESEIVKASYYPIKVWRDYENIQIYKICEPANDEPWCDDDCVDCSQGEVYTSRKPLDKMADYLDAASETEGCEAYYNIGLAGFYFLETKEYWNQVQGERGSCQASFQQDVEREVLYRPFVDWLVVSCDIEIRDDDFKGWFDEFVNITSNTLNEETVIVPETNRTEEITITQTEPESSVKCVFENNKYLKHLCTASRTVEDVGENQGVDSFNILFVAFVLIILFMILTRRRR